MEKVATTYNQADLSTPIQPVKTHSRERNITSNMVDQFLGAVRGYRVKTICLKSNRSDRFISLHYV